MKVSQEALNFLAELEKNNNKEWFNAKKNQYKIYQTEIKSFFSELEIQLSKTDLIEKPKIYRIYRDIRFSLDKTPFKTNYSGGFQRATAELRGGYFLSIGNNQTIVGGGFYAPEPLDLKRIRDEFEMDDSEIREITNASQFKKMFGKLQGEELKTAPRGFDVNHRAIDLIRMKQFYVIRNFSNEAVTSSDFSNKVIETFEAMRPYFDYMSSVLTTNLDGESIL